VDAEGLRERVLAHGARACGFAPAERFSGAPEGFRPRDVFPDCRTVVVFLKEMPLGAITAGHPIPYTHAAYQLYGELDRIGMETSRTLEAMGARGVPVPSDTPYLHWEAERSRGMGILSLRHAALLAGLGRLGRNTLLIHPELGNLVYLGAVLTDAVLPGDPLLEGSPCPERCGLCLEVCPAGALDGVTVDQARCRPQSFFRTERGFDLYACNRCRRVCPRLRSAAGA